MEYDVQQVMLCKSSQVVAKHQLVQDKLAKKEKKALLSKKSTIIEHAETLKSPESKQTKLPFRKRDAKFVSKLDHGLLEFMNDNDNVEIDAEGATITIDLPAIRNAE